MIRACEKCGAAISARSKSGCCRRCAVRAAWAKKRTPEILFWPYVAKSEDCWLWIGCSSRDGYGKATLDSRSAPAHRVAWLLAHGTIPPGLSVLHKCDTRRCVRPDHLFLGTHAENMADMVAKGRAARPRGELAGSAQLTAEQVVEARNRCRSGEKIHAIAASLGRPAPTVRHAITGYSWGHLPGAIVAIPRRAKAVKP